MIKIPINEFDLPDIYPLSRCIRWVAFKEYPIEESLAQILYPNTRYTRAEKKQFLEAYRQVVTLLVSGKMRGIYKYRRDTYSDCTEGFFKMDANDPARFIDPLNWKHAHHLSLDKRLRGILSNKLYGCILSNKFDKMTVVDPDYLIELFPLFLQTKDLLRFFPQAGDEVVITSALNGGVAKEPSRAGRKKKFDWDEFHREVIRYVNCHPDGMPQNKEEMIRIMSEWCLNKWGVEPSEGSIKNYVYAIYKYLES